MSSEAAPISAARFASALCDLPLSTLHLKAVELRNSIAHLDYSNEQLLPFATGADASTNGVPDPDCADAIRENEVVIARQTERIALLRAEVEGRGCSWAEFQDAEGLKPEREGEGGGDRERAVNGTGGEGRSSAWTDGTFQTGRIVNGEVEMDGDAENGTGAGDGDASAGRVTNGVNGTGSVAAGGRLDDEALRRAMEERMGALAEEGDGEGGMHL
ncbi:hypothetical protein LZ554_005207 [Drepanopeziza brunnea f. sp. 'monogermtubi']|nr:hypothetical protein LZ554_005207 [Drepanopeziza brunnea f. sp. 'monogermtubi']